MSDTDGHDRPESTGEAIYAVDHDGRITCLNATAERLTGWRAADAIGCSYHDVVELVDRDGQRCSDANDPVARTLTDGDSRRIEHGVRRGPKDPPTPVHGTVDAQYGTTGTVTGAIVMLRGAAGHSDERRYHSLVVATSDFVWHSRPDGALEQISGAWLELVGLDASEAAEFGWLDAVHPDDRRGYERTWREAVAQGVVHVQEYRLLCHDGRTRWFIDRAVPVRDDSGAIVEWIGAGREITARREAEEELRRQREQYRTLVESTSAILWEADPQTFAFTFVSSEAESLLGYPAERWTREPGFWIDHIHPDDREWAPAYCQRATEELCQHTFDYRMLAADGRVVWLRDVVSVLTDDDDRPVKLVGVMVDITNTKQTEQQLAYVSGLQQILVEAAEGLVAAGPDEVDAAINEVLRRIGEYCEVDRSYMFRFDDEERATMTHEWHAPDVEPLIDGLVARPSTATPSLVAKMQRREVLHIPRVSDLGRDWEADREAFAEQGLRSIVIVPIVIDDRVYGYVGFDSVQRETEWRDEEIALLRGLADTIGATVQRDRADRQRQQSETRFRALAEHLPGVVYERVMHPDGTIELTYLSHNVARLFGLDPEQAIADPRAILESIHPDDRAAYTDALQRSAAEISPLDLGHRMVAPDGSTRWARLLGEPRTNEDGSVTWHGITIDETERVEAEQRLRESRALQEIAGRTARVGGWVMDLERQELQWSDEVYAIHEVAPGTPLTVESRLAFYTPEYRDRIREAYFACAEQGIPYDEEAEIRTAGGQRLWVRMIGEAVRDDSGRIVQVRGAFQDVTEQKEAREEASRLARRLASTLESMTDAFFTVDCDWRIGYLNRQAERLMGVARGDIQGKDLWTEYPDLVGTVVEHEYRRAMAENSGSEFEFYYPTQGTWFEIRTYPSEEGLGVYFRDVTGRKRAQAEIEFLAFYDPLTQLPNRRLLLDRLGHALDTTGRTGLRCAILFLDLDNFKTLNDTLGHDIGDRMLQQAGRRLRDCVRRSDTVARFGGDEFAVVLERLAADRDDAVARASQVAEKIRTELAKPYDLGDHERRTTVSVGVTLFGEDTDDSAGDVMKRADLAMYQAKDAGGGTVRMFDPSMRAAVQSRVALEDALRKALDNGEIVPWFQPQFDAQGRLIGAEALARWLSSDRDPVLPAEFIPVAEETGLIIPLGDAMLESACEQIVAWTSQPRLAALNVSVNVSPRQFHQPAFVEKVRAIIERTGVSTEHLWLELTESLLLEDVEDTIRKMTALRAYGVRFTLDDFGTGYSSLAYLKRLPLDQVKIDQGFVRDALTDPNDAAIVRTIIVLAQTMGMEVVAEGVETDAVRAMLEAEGCTAYQGFLYSPAVPADRFEELAGRYDAARSLGSES